VFVAGFIGSPRMNFIRARRYGDGSIGIGDNRIRSKTHAEVDAPIDKLNVGIRPEHFVVVAGGKGMLRAKVELYEYLGGTRFLCCQLSDGQSIVAEHRSSVPVNTGAIIDLSWEIGQTHCFGTDGLRLESLSQPL
jgi:lactose/L-arabinose transport system ATP-binding protein